ncbi:MAG: response regulator transcription factor, partial [Chloroflexi bacterium]|nr:response regulator transcription factor [Chloroflexota bacterium]
AHLPLAQVLILPVAALMLAHGGAYGRAAELLGLAFAHPVNITTWMERWPRLAQLRAALEAALGAAGYRSAWERGASADLGAALAHVGQHLNDQHSAAAPESEAQTLVDPLSDRELEVLRLLAQGMSNRDIAARLFLSVGTVKVHARNIYGKLGVSNRTEAVTAAYQLRLI